MGIIRVYIVAGLVGIAAASAGPSQGRAREADGGPPVGRDNFLLVPMRDPLADYDANTMAWHSARDFLNVGIDAMFQGLGWRKSVVARTTQMAFSTYACMAMNYYSHEVAHGILNRTSRHFRVDLSDWSRSWLVFIPTSVPDQWDPEELEYYNRHPYDAHIYEWYTKSNESGFYQQTLNARFTARLSSLSGSTAFTDGVAFYINQWYQFEYIRKFGDDPTILVRTEYGLISHHNDVTAYLNYMSILGTEISKDTWLSAAGLCALLSGQMWNSVLSAYGFIVHGEEARGGIEFGRDDGVRVAPPNFYLFPTLFGLYVESETSIRGIGGSEGVAFLTLGTGLDSFGIEGAGDVDTVRFGAMYGALTTPLPVELSPFVYLDFDGGMKQRGYSVGVTVETTPLWRVFLSAKFEYNRGDMIEQVVKSRDDGFYAIAGLGFRM